MRWWGAPKGAVPSSRPHPLKVIPISRDTCGLPGCFTGRIGREERFRRYPISSPDVGVGVTGAAAFQAPGGRVD